MLVEDSDQESGLNSINNMTLINNFTQNRLSWNNYLNSDKQHIQQQSQQQQSNQKNQGEKLQQQTFQSKQEQKTKSPKKKNNEVIKVQKVENTIEDKKNKAEKVSQKFITVESLNNTYEKQSQIQSQKQSVKEQNITDIVNFHANKAIQNIQHMINFQQSISDIAIQLNNKNQLVLQYYLLKCSVLQFMRLRDSFLLKQNIGNILQIKYLEARKSSIQKKLVTKNVNNQNNNNSYSNSYNNKINSDKNFLYYKEFLEFCSMKECRKIVDRIDNILDETQENLMSLVSDNGDIFPNHQSIDYILISEDIEKNLHKNICISNNVQKQIYVHQNQQQDLLTIPEQKEILQIFKNIFMEISNIIYKKNYNKVFYFNLQFQILIVLQQVLQLPTKSQFFSLIKTQLNINQSEDIQNEKLLEKSLIVYDAQKIIEILNQLLQYQNLKSWCLLFNLNSNNNNNNNNSNNNSSKCKSAQNNIILNNISDIQRDYNSSSPVKKKRNQSFFGTKRKSSSNASDMGSFSTNFSTNNNISNQDQSQQQQQILSPMQMKGKNMQ